MAKILSIDDMLEAASECGLPSYREHVNALEGVAQHLADDLAKHLQIEVGLAEWEGKAFAGLCAPFWAAKPGQECPDVIDQGDEEGDWEPEPHRRNKV